MPSGSSKKKDKKIYNQLKRRDKEAFIDAYDLYLDDIYRFIYFKVSDKHEVEDLSSQVFLKTWDHIQNNSLKDYNTLKSLLYTVARNLVIDHYRKSSNQFKNINIDNEDIKYELVDEKQDVKKEIEIKIDYQKIQDKLSELKEEYREAIILRYVNELSINEISEVLNKTKGNVRVLIYRAVNALKEINKN